MRKNSLLLLSLALSLLVCGFLLNPVVAAASADGAPTTAAAAPGDRLIVAGMIKTSTGKGVKDAEVEILVNGKEVKPPEANGGIVTGKSGAFAVDLTLPAGTFPAPR